MAAAARAAHSPPSPAAETGRIHTVAGTGLFTGDQVTFPAPLGDGGPAGVAPLDFPTGVAALADGAIAIADQRNNRVRVVDASGIISTLATARFPDGVAAAADGGVLVAEALNNRVLHISRTGVSTVVAGDGVRGFAGDGGPAVAARLSRPVDVASAPDGAVLIADGSNRVRRVGADGVIVTVAGTGRGNTSGDAGPARDATLWKPGGVAPAAGGGILVADTFSNRIRWVASALPAAQGSPPAPRLLAISFRRPIQRGEAGIVTHLRAACPPRGVAVRFALSSAADVTLAVTRAGRRVARLRSRLSPGPHVWRFRVARTGEHRLRLTATSARRIAVDQAQVSVNRCPASG